jgi:cobalt-zinc-cadmium efflux system outer membrane protein
MRASFGGVSWFLRVCGPLLVVLGAASTAQGQAAPPPPVAGPTPAVPPSVALQAAALNAPTPSHPTLATGDAAGPGRADGGPGVPPPEDLPLSVGLDDALHIFRARGFGILIADAGVVSAQGAERSASAVFNPQLNLGYGRVLSYPSSGLCPGFTPGMPTTYTFGCSPNQYTAGLSDNAAIEDSLVGKRHLRMKVARAALAAAKMNRADAERTLTLEVKSAYYQAVQARKAYDFAVEVMQDSETLLDKNRDRLNDGKINQGDFERIRQTTLEAEQSVDMAFQALRQAKVALAFLLGVRGRVPEFEIDKEALKFLVPQHIAAATADSLLRQAFGKRPDLLALGYQEERAGASISLAKRERFPDIALSAQYTQTGSGQSAIQPPTISFGLAGNLPIFYQQQGEVLQAQADYTTQRLTRAQTAAQVVSDVETAYAGYLGTRTLVERMENALLASARVAKDITKVQFLAGKGNLTDYLVARQAFVQTNVEYFQDLTNYWTAVAQLEAAVGSELK